MDLSHWHYFLAIEEDLLRLSRFIEFSKKNASTFSLENARILMAATQEVDVLLKRICKKHGKPGEKEPQYRKELSLEIPKLLTIEVSFLLGDIISCPYKAWASGKTPEWWTANNKIKHERHNHYEKASLSCVLDAVAGLFLANLYFYFPLEANELLFPRAKLIFSDEVSTVSRPTVFSVNPMILAVSAHYELP
jgi:hypothetical protein